MKKWLVTSIIIISLVLFYGCDPVDDRLLISNQSDEIIFYSINKNDSVSGRSLLNNAFELDSKKDTVWQTGWELILPHQTKNITIIGRNGWEHFINESDDGEIKIFLFSKALLQHTPWDTILARQHYTKKYSLSVDELEKIDWTVVFKE